MSLQEALNKFETWEEIEKAYKSGLIDGDVYVALLEYFQAL